MNTISAAFVKAQKEFGPALKSSTNPHFKSKYADLSACVEAVIDGLNNNGIALMQINHEHNEGIVIETVFIHESGERLSNGKLFVPAAKHDPQGYGSALTYARRYSLMAACGIAPEDDDGNASKATPKAVVTLPPKSAALAPKLKNWDQFYDEAETMLAGAAFQEDVMEIFKSHKATFDSMKAEVPDIFSMLMEKFTATKAKLPSKGTK
jgi:hypothetical protein